MSSSQALCASAGCAAAGPSGTAPGGQPGAAPGNPAAAANEAPAAGALRSHCSNCPARSDPKELQSVACPRAADGCAAKAFSRSKKRAAAPAKAASASREPVVKGISIMYATQQCGELHRAFGSLNYSVEPTGQA